MRLCDLRHTREQLVERHIQLLRHRHRQPHLATRRADLDRHVEHERRTAIPFGEARTLLGAALALIATLSGSSLSHLQVGAPAVLVGLIHRHDRPSARMSSTTTTTCSGRVHSTMSTNSLTPTEGDVSEMTSPPLSKASNSASVMSIDHTLSKTWPVSTTP